MDDIYNTFNDVLLQNINASAADGRAPVPKQNGTGKLVIQTVLAGGALPLSGVSVVVSDGNTGRDAVPDIRLVTDESGRTEPIVLPTVSYTLSQAPTETERPYSVYNITAELDGFYPEKLVNIPIFDKTTSVQPIMMIPLSERSVPDAELYIDESAAT